jgi:short-subunit dehydrogenase
VRAELRATGVGISCVIPTITRTEPAAGLKETRLSSQVAPVELAGAVVDAIETGRFEVWGPRHLGPLNRFVRVVPRAFGE